MITMRYSDAELERMLGDLESDLLECKESWNGDAPDKGRQAICAFANDLPDHRKPGVLIVGIKDDGSASSLPITDELLRTLADIKSDGQIVPPPTLLVERRQIRGNEVAVITVQPADAPPVRYRGRTWIRIGPRRGVTTSQDERILSEKRRFRDLPFDVQPVPGCEIEALNSLLFSEEYLPNAIAPDILASNDRTYEQRLAACKMIQGAETPIPTVLGLLIIGKSARDWLPGAYVQFLRIKGRDWSDPISDETVIDGPLGQIIRRLDEKLSAHNSVAVDLTSEPTERRFSPYPQVALQQLTRNALMHRSYEATNTPVRVYWFDDRIEIHNPGGPYGTVTVENFGRPGVTDYRNPHIAESMKVLGFVQRFGVGIPTAQAELRRNGNPEAEFIRDPSTIVAIVRVKP
jgi:ATP-dependent DNA helicase RecG